MEKILIVDDEEKIVEVIKSYLENGGYTCYTAHNGNDALSIFERVNPALIILDLMLPDITGEEICKTIRKKSRVPIIMLTAKIEEESILKGLDIGADDYMTKPFSPKQLLARIAAILRRTNSEDMPLANELSFDNNRLVINFTKHEVTRDNIVINLTKNEFKILTCLAKYPSKVFTRDEIIEALKFDGYDRTIDAHIKNLRRKLEKDPKNPKYILTIHGVGYRFGGE